MIRKIVNILRYVFVRHRKYQFARQGKKVIIGNGCIINSASMIEFGDNVSIGPNAVLYAIYKKIIFGNNVMLGPHVTIVNGDHNIRKIGVAIIDNHEKLPEDDSDVIIGDDVWIGYDALIMPGVTIGKGSVIGARAIVTKDVPPYSIYVGNKVIKKRFSEDIINKLSIIDFSKVEHTSFDTYINYCQTEITSSNVDDILECFVTRK